MGVGHRFSVNKIACHRLFRASEFEIPERYAIYDVEGLISLDLIFLADGFLEALNHNKCLIQEINIKTGHSLVLQDRNTSWEFQLRSIWTFEIGLEGDSILFFPSKFLDVESCEWDRAITFLESINVNELELIRADRLAIFQLNWIDHLKTIFESRISNLNGVFQILSSEIGIQRNLTHFIQGCEELGSGKCPIRDATFLAGGYLDRSQAEYTQE